MSLKCSENLETKGNIKLKMFYIGGDDASNMKQSLVIFLALLPPPPSLPRTIQLLNDANLTQV